MDSYLEDILYLYGRDTNWDESFTYNYIIKTTDDLLRFNIPSSFFKLSISAENSKNNFCNFEFTKSLYNKDRIQGHISYGNYKIVDNYDFKYLKKQVLKNEDLASNIIKINKNIRKSIDINEYINNFSKYYKDFINGNNAKNFNHVISSALNSNINSDQYDIIPIKNFKSSQFAYGKMLFTGDVDNRTITTGMLIRQLSLNSRFLMKFHSDSKFKSLNSTSYFQYQGKKTFMELTYNTNETLLGIRGMKRFLSSGLDKSSFKVGFELWHGFKNFTPHSSITFQYDTVSTQHLKPLNFTMNINPLLGHVVLTFGMWENLHYYDPINRKRSGMFSHLFFNLYSLKSNLNIGYQYKEMKIACNFNDRLVRLKHGIKLSDNFTLSWGGILIFNNDLMNKDSIFDTLLQYGFELKYIS